MIQKKALTAAFANLFARILLVAGVLLVANTGPAPAEEAPPLEGEFADNFTLLDPPVPAPLEVFQDLTGGRVRLADFKGQVVVLNFWATWCPPCVREMPSLDRLQAALREEGLAVVAVSIDRGGADVINPFAASLNLEEMGIYWDAKSNLAKAFGVIGLPTTFIIDRQSRIIAHHRRATRIGGMGLTRSRGPRTPLPSGAAGREEAERCAELAESFVTWQLVAIHACSYHWRQRVHWAQPDGGLACCRAPGDRCHAARDRSASAFSRNRNGLFRF